MSKSVKLLLAALAAVGLAAPIVANAAEARPVSCAVTVDYLLNNVVRAHYQKDFVVMPGVPYEDDFSTFTRFRFFDASTRLENDKTVVYIGYYNDVGVFEAVDLRTKLVIHDDKPDDVTSGRHMYFTELGVAGDHTTDYTLACHRLKD